MATQQRLINKLKAARGWSASQKIPYELKDADGEVIETLYIQPVTRAAYRKVTESLDEKTKGDLTLRLVVQNCFLQDGSKAFASGDIAALKREFPQNLINQIEMSVVDAGKIEAVAAFVEAEKKDSKATG